MKWLRVILAALLVSAATQVIATGVANAWSGPLPSCNSSTDSWMTTIQSDPRYTAGTSWVAFYRDWTGAPFYGQEALAVMWNPPTDGTASQSNQLFFVGDGVDDSSDGFSIPASSSLYRIDATTGGMVDVSAGQLGTYSTYYDLTCVQSTRNVGYQSWVGATYPASTATLVSGTVDCGGVDPSAMSIVQSGNNGAAILATPSAGTATWSYSLTSDNYSMSVDCGGRVATGAGYVSPADRNWVCDIFSPPYPCRLG